MIKKLRNKISLIIMFAITVPLLIIIMLYTFSYYNNTIRTNTGFVDRFIFEPKGRMDNSFDISEIDGIYSITIIENVIQTNNNTNTKIEKYALKISRRNKESGIIGNYIYKKRTKNIKETTIILIESSSEINKLKLVITSIIILTIIGIVLIYILSKKIANLIVKPVEETFTRQTEFISDASHELKTPLAVIRANADVLEGELKNNKWLKYIQNETDNMEKLISELLLLTKIENIDKLRKPEKFNMSEHIELIAATFESMAYEKNVKIETKIEKNIITNKFNKEDINHILSTLIDNAIKHTEEKKKVIIEFKKNKDNIEINVKNKGKEIPISEREKIFDRFYRIDKSRNRNEKRYGLGLAIAKSTVLKNNGTISVDYKEGFTIFKVKLPI